MRHIVLSIFALVSILFVVSEVQAQEEPTWKKVCVDTKKPETCRLVQEHYLVQTIDGKQKTLGRILGLTVVYIDDSSKRRQLVLSIQMPLGVDLRAGAAFRVDGGKDVNAPFLQCTGNGCDVSVKLDSKLLESFKAGRELVVAFRPWGGGETKMVKSSK